MKINKSTKEELKVEKPTNAITTAIRNATETRGKENKDSNGGRSWTEYPKDMTVYLDYIYFVTFHLKF